jgi:hypothetical protein
MSDQLPSKDLCECKIKASTLPGNGTCVKCGKPIFGAAQPPGDGYDANGSPVTE